LVKEAKPQYFRNDLTFIISRFTTLMDLLFGKKEVELQRADSIYTSPLYKWGQKTVEEQEFAFVFNLLEACFATTDCPQFLLYACLNSIKYYFNEFEIKITQDTQKRAITLVEKASLQKFLDFVKTFKLDGHFSNEYMVTRAKDALAKEELNTAAKIILDRHLFSEFDIFDLCSKLG
jgi:hypothetical protein